MFQLFVRSIPEAIKHGADCSTGKKRYVNFSRMKYCKLSWFADFANVCKKLSSKNYQLKVSKLLMMFSITIHTIFFPTEMGLQGAAFSSFLVLYSSFSTVFLCSIGCSVSRRRSCSSEAKHSEKRNSSEEFERD